MKFGGNDTIEQYEILEILRGYNVDVRKCDRGEVIITVKNMYPEWHNIEIILGDELALRYAGVSQKYSKFSDFKNDVIDILLGEKAVFRLFNHIGYVGSCFYKGGKPSIFTNEEKMLKHNWNDKTMIDKILLLGGIIEVVYWDINSSFKYDIFENGNRDGIKYLCNGMVRYSIKEGEVLAHIKYRLVDDYVEILQHFEDKIDAVKEQLLMAIEYDACSAGCKYIFADAYCGCEVDFYRKEAFETFGHISLTEGFCSVMKKLRTPTEIKKIKLMLWDQGPCDIDTQGRWKYEILPNGQVTKYTYCGSDSKYIHKETAKVDLEKYAQFSKALNTYVVSDWKRPVETLGCDGCGYKLDILYEDNFKANYSGNCYGGSIDGIFVAFLKDVFYDGEV